MNVQSQPFEQAHQNSISTQPLLWLSGLCSAIYFVTKSWQPYTGSIALKALSIAPLAIIALQSLRHAGRHTGRSTDRLLLVAALCFSCLGDILLDWPGNHFVQGLLAFLVTQVLYVALFMRNWQRPWHLRNDTRWLAAVVLLVSISMTVWMLPSLGKLTIPVIVYFSTLTLMTESAILAQFKCRWIAIGAILFFLSDSLIGVNRFKLALPLRDYLVWGTYYIGQCGITLGYIREKTQKQ